MRYAALLCLAVVVACEGPMGPAGPAGPQGIQGITGPAGPQGPPGTTKLRQEGQLDFEGFAEFALPAAAGTLSSPPVFECYLAWSVSGETVWAKVGDPLFDPDGTCFIADNGQTLSVGLQGSIGGQPYTIIVVY